LPRKKKFGAGDGAVVSTSSWLYLPCKKKSEAGGGFSIDGSIKRSLGGSYIVTRMFGGRRHRFLRRIKDMFITIARVTSF